MSSAVSSAWRDGLLRVVRAPAVVAGVFVVTLAVTAPLALTLRAAIDRHLGQSLSADAAADGVNVDWWQEFLSQASGAAATFTPAIIGFAATLDSISSVADARAPALPIAATIATYLFVWTFLSGGIIDRYARGRPTRAAGFFSAAGAYSWRLLRLSVIAWGVYWLLFRYLHPLLLDDAYGRLTRDVAAERTAFGWRMLLYGVFGGILLAANLVFDYARIRLVVEDRRSVVGALRASVAFLRRHAGRAPGLYAFNTLVFLALILVWAMTAPGVSGAGWGLWIGVVWSQVYVLARLALKLQFIASQTALFQASLAHAGYTAAAPAKWSESAAVESMNQTGDAFRPGSPTAG